MPDKAWRHANQIVGLADLLEFVHERWIAPDLRRPDIESLTEFDLITLDLDDSLYDFDALLVQLRDCAQVTVVGLPAAPPASLATASSRFWLPGPSLAMREFQADVKLVPADPIICQA